MSPGPRGGRGRDGACERTRAARRRGYGSRACGFGRDFSVGWSEDGSGNDRYFRLPDELADVRYEPFDWGEGSYEGRVFEPPNLDYRGRGTSMRNGARISWFGVFDDRPASTGAAIDAR